MESALIRLVKNNAEYLETRQIRKEVFSRGQGIPEELDNDGLDSSAEHIIVKDPGLKPWACVVV